MQKLWRENKHYYIMEACFGLGSLMVNMIQHQNPMPIIHLEGW
jgi:hypothetical protein